MDDRADVVSVFLCYPIRNRISDMIGFEGLNTARSFVLLTITITIPLLMVLRNLCIFVVASLPSWLFVDNVLCYLMLWLHITSHICAFLC